MPDLPDPAPSALPSPMARAVAFGSIIVAGLCGGLIGYAFIDLQSEDPGALATVGALVGVLVAGGGTAVVAVLALRAMGEWAGDDPERILGRDEIQLGPPAEQIRGPDDTPS